MTSAATQTQGSTQIAGTVARVIFRNQANNYTIAALRSDSIPSLYRSRFSPTQFTASGILMRAAPGQSLSLTGKWVHNAQYGWQFAIESYEEVAPKDHAAIVEYLSSGLFKGIGEKTAEAIVAAFGDKTLDVIKNTPERLGVVKGISGTRIAAIMESYRQTARLENLMLALKPFHISTPKIVKIHQVLGDNALDEIQKNPYTLCDAVEGIGFRTADLIALHHKLSANDPARLRAGITYTLMEVAAAEGHVFLPFDKLIDMTRTVLQKGEIKDAVDRNSLIRAAVDMNNAHELVIERDNSGDATYLPAFHSNESYVATKLQVLTRTRVKPIKLDLEQTIRDLSQKNGITYTARQKDAFHLLGTTNVMILTGGPGTGKTTIIKGFIDLLRKANPSIRIALAAPTGRAAKRMEEATGMAASTIHRLLEYRPDKDGITCGRNDRNPLEEDVVIIDESSMIDMDLQAKFLRAVRPSTMLVFVGDVDQLPSVGAGNVLRDMIDSGVIPTVQLNENRRNDADSLIVVNATKINRGEKDLEYGPDFVLIPAQGDEIADVLVSQLQSELARVGDLAEVQALSPFRRTTEMGVNRLNERLQERLNPKEYREKPEIRYGSRIFRLGDKVIQHKNNYDKEVFNGDQGLISFVNSRDGALQVAMSDAAEAEEDVLYAREDLDELYLAYAITIHKSQGCEYDTVLIPVTMQHERMLVRNLLYTGVTRAKKKVVLVGEEKALLHAIANNRVDNRYSKLKERLRGVA